MNTVLSCPRILWVGDSPTVSTGFARCTRAVCDHLEKLGWDVNILGLNYYGSPHDFPYKIYPCYEPTDFGLDVYGRYRLARLIVTLEPDVVVILNDPWNIKGYLQEIDRIRDRISIPPIISWLAVDSKNQRGYELNDPLISHVAVWTQFAADELVKGGYKNNDSSNTGISIVPLGVDTSIFYQTNKAESRRLIFPDIIDALPLPDDAYIVGVVGRNQYRKRLDLTIEYFAEWIKSKSIDNAYLYLYIAPTGDTGGCDIRSLVKYYGIGRRVILAEPNIGVGQDEQFMRSVYSAMDCYLTTSQAEGWGLPALEAMACGVSCILPDAAAFSAQGGWTKEVALHVPCLSRALTAPLNSFPYTIGSIPNKSATVQSLQLIYTEERWRQALSERGMALARDLTWDNTARLFREVLERVLHFKHEFIEVTSFADPDRKYRCECGATYREPHE